MILRNKLRLLENEAVGEAGRAHEERVTYLAEKKKKLCALQVGRLKASEQRRAGASERDSQAPGESPGEAPAL